MNKKNTTLSLLVIGIFFLSAVGTAPPAIGQGDFIKPNFDLWFYTNVGNTRREAFGFYLKQAVAPLGINLKVIAKPWNQFVGDLLHFTTSTPYDIALVGFSGGSPNFDIGWRYHSECAKTSYGCLTYQLDNTEWQDWQFTDTQVRSVDVDALMDELDFSVDPIVKAQKVAEFDKLFMEKLLYDLPTVSRTSKFSIWKGYGGANNELYHEDRSDDPVFSIPYGAYWGGDGFNPSERIGGDRELRMATAPHTKIFDPQQVFDTATGVLSDYTFNGALMFDEFYEPHPGTAYNWIAQDWDNGTVVSEAGNHTYWLNEGIYWSGSKDGQIKPHEFTAHDIIFALQLMQMTNTVSNGKNTFVPYVDWKIYNDYTFSIFIEKGLTSLDDMFNTGIWSPMPAHVLNVTMDKGSDSWGSPIEMDEDGENPQTSDQWVNLMKDEDKTISLGMMLVDSYVTGETFSFVARDKRTGTDATDFWYPNEWDTENTAYAYRPSDATGLPIGTTKSATSDHSKVLGGIFAPHVYNATPDAEFWAFDSTEALRVKPSMIPIQDVTYIVMDDPNAELIKFENGELDVFFVFDLGLKQIDFHATDPKFKVVSPKLPLSSDLFMFNLLNPHIKKYNVRKAIAHVLDKTQMIKIIDGLATASDSVVSNWQIGYSTVNKIPYDYAAARDLMRSEGYDAQQDNAPETNPLDIPTSQVVSQIEEEGAAVIEEITETLGSDLLFGLFAFAITTFALIRRRKK